MAYFKGMRLALVAAIGIIATATVTASAHDYFDSGGTATVTASGYDNSIIFYAVPADVAMVAMPAVADVRRAANVPPSSRPKANKERASRSAVRPTAFAGWRSGRTRTLALC